MVSIANRACISQIVRMLVQNLRKPEKGSQPAFTTRLHKQTEVKAKSTPSAALTNFEVDLQGICSAKKGTDGPDHSWLPLSLLMSFG